ncbi:hypothetical protein GGI17_006487 [Coemansia sp. S146]|nr:hypothetical protein GGI17_006487 [Coemansia sp. S146]
MTMDNKDNRDTQDTQETKDYVVLLKTRDKMEDEIQAYDKWMYSSIEYLKIQGHVINRLYAMRPMVLRLRTLLLFGKGIYLFGDRDDYFGDDAKIIVLNMKDSNWSIVTDRITRL